MSTGRLGGGGARKPAQDVNSLTRRHIWRYASMAEAVRAAQRRIFAGHAQHDERRKAAARIPLDGDKRRLEQAIADSEELIEDAIAYDQRLANRAKWRRRDEGEHVDTALLSQGDDQPFYKHTKQIINESTGSGERVRIVVSTDSNNVPRGAAAAFIASIRIVQQFVPLEVWWQGAWLTEDQCRGFVFHVPLVQGDMDFSRLDYCIADNTRDSLSWMIMAAYGVNDAHESWNDCDHRAGWSHMPGKGRFVSHDGVSPNANSIAQVCCQWLGIEPPWQGEYQQRQNESNALQRMPPEKTNEAGTPPTAEQLEAQQKWEKEWKDKQLMEAKQRTLAAQTVNI